MRHGSLLTVSVLIALGLCAPSGWALSPVLGAATTVGGHFGDRAWDKPASPGKSEEAKSKDKDKDKGKGEAVSAAATADREASVPASAAVLAVIFPEGLPASVSSAAGVRKAVESALDSKVSPLVIQAVLRGALEPGLSAAEASARAEAALKRLVRVVALTHGGSWPRDASRDSFQILAERALAHGVGERALSAVVTWALEDAGAPLRAAESLGMAAELKRIFLGDEAFAAAMARALAESPVPEARYAELSGLAERAAAAGVPASGFLEAVRTPTGPSDPLAIYEYLLF